MPVKKNATENVFKRSDHDKWYTIRYDIPGPNGTRKQKWEVCKGMTKKEAEQHLRDIQSSVYRGDYVQEYKITLEEYMEQWLNSHENDLSPTTLEVYQKQLRKRVFPVLGNYTIGKLRPSHVQALYKTLEDVLATKTIKNIHSMLHNAFSHAVKFRDLRSNPFDAVTPPRVHKTERTVISEEDATKLLTAVEGWKYKIPFWIIFCTGLRRGEALGLCWDDLDFVRGVFVVRHNLIQVKDGLMLKTTTKTGRIRTVAIPPTLIGLLKQHRAEQTATHGVSTKWICTDKNGKVLSPEGFSRAFGRLANDIGVDAVIHSMRHTQVSLLAMAGVPVAVIAERLGHLPATAQNIYTHVLPHNQAVAVDVVEDMLQRIKPNENNQEK
jgi:integrase